MEPTQGSQWSSSDSGLFSFALAELVREIRTACAAAEEWPAKVGAGLYAGLDYFAEQPAMGQALLDDAVNSSFASPFRQLVRSMEQLLDETVPLRARPGPAAPAALIAGIGLIVGDYIRLGRPELLSALRAELHLLILLPFLGFGEAKLWADMVEQGEIT